MIRNTLNLAMILCLVVVMDYRFIENAIYEMLGLFTLLLLIIHNTINKSLPNKETKKEANGIFK